MSKKKQDYLKQIYKQNPETNAYIIEVSLDDYNDIFNGWDPSPIRRRDLERDLVSFIEDCFYDITVKNKIEFQFFLPESKFDERKEYLSIKGIKNYFKFTAHLIKKEIKENRKKIIKYIVMSFIFLTLAYLSNIYITLDVLTNTIVQGLFIGGWIFLWEAFSLFFFLGQEVRARLIMYERFFASPIIFTYK